MNLWVCAAMAAALGTLAGGAQSETREETAAIFGARESIEAISLSPDGTQLAYIAPGPGQSSVLVVRGVADDAPLHPILRSGGDPERLTNCHWVSNKRLVCQIYGITNIEARKMGFSRLFAIDTDGNNVRELSTRQSADSHGIQLHGGSVVDWLPDEDGAVLMTRVYIPDDRTGSLVASRKDGLAVDRVNTVTGAVQTIEPAQGHAADFISDGRGVVRIAGYYSVQGATDQLSDLISYSYRLPGSRDWRPLSVVKGTSGEGFNPFAVDHDLNVAYGFKKKAGRYALYALALDGSLRETLVYSHDDVDVTGLVRIGRRNRVVGVTYETDSPQVAFFDPQIGAIVGSLAKAIPHQPNLRVVDASVDEHKLLIFAGSDSDPGVYYLFDRDKRDLHIIAAARTPMIGRTSASMRAIRYRATDGTMVPAYLTLPPGKENAKGLPAIVMPHGGPSARDSWGFDWLPQFYAARGYAVLQPEYRGSSGYGDGWYQKNGFRSWRSAIGDVVDAGRWLIGEGAADPTKLAIVGWSYGGYAALQSAVIAPDLFKAVVAIAPVTDLASLKNESLQWNDDAIRGDFIGSGPHIREGSPAQNADRIKIPVLLVHGTLDANVAYAESTLMQARLKAAGGKVQLMTFDGLDHQLEDSAARTKLLAESDAFLRAAMEN